MIVEVLAVGTELLLGQTVNTNATRIGARLAAAGLDHFHQSVVGDNVERITAAVELACTRSDALIITGGIGPTLDDLTRDALCRAAGVEMLFSDEYAEELRIRWEARGRRMPESNLRQAQYPEGAELIRNPKGTAPALRMRIAGTWVFAVPGVPAEMEWLVGAHVIPFLIEEEGGGESVVASRVVRTWGASESEVGELLADLYEAGSNPSLAFLASSGEIKVRLTAKARDAHDASALIAPLEAEVVERLGARVFGFDDEAVEVVLLGLLSKRRWSLATAESATGGMVAARITSVPGSSQVFRGAVVAYHEEVKRLRLGVAAATLEDHGPVSAEVGLEMAEGAARTLGADVAVAITGAAGPEPHGRPAGTMVVAVRTPEDARARVLRMPGDRERVRTYTTTAALHLARLAVAGGWWSEDPSTAWGVRPGGGT